MEKTEQEWIGHYKPSEGKVLACYYADGAWHNEVVDTLTEPFTHWQPQPGPPFDVVQVD